MQDERELLQSYVRAGTLMQVATLDAHGTPRVCNVWYDPQFEPDALRFISRHDREHSHNIRRDGRVAGAIIAIALEGLGQTARGVTFSGVARELPRTSIDAEAQAFIRRWPRAAGIIDPGKLSRNETASRLYEIAVTEWVLFDEHNYPRQPRRVINAMCDSGPAKREDGET